MPITRIKVNNYRALGELFIEWALDKKKAPTDKAGFIKAVVDTGIVAPLPEYIETFDTVQYDKKDLVLRLPPKELVQDTLDAISKGNDYFLPDFYAKRTLGYEQLLDDRIFFGHRIGDYTIAHCS
jgi:hypothetical protein